MSKKHDGLVPIMDLPTLHATLTRAGFHLCINRDCLELPTFTPLKRSICSGGGQFEVLDGSGKLVASFCTQAGVVNWVCSQKNQPQL